MEAVWRQRDGLPPLHETSACILHFVFGGEQRFVVTNLEHLPVSCLVLLQHDPPPPPPSPPEPPVPSASWPTLAVTNTNNALPLPDCGSMSCMVGPSWPHIACMCLCKTPHAPERGVGRPPRN
eukprot:scaffold1348_cov130-Isochrysis_galbana.AAC.1